MKRKIYSYLIVLLAGLVVLQYQACGKFTPSEGLVLGSSKSPATFRDEILDDDADEEAIAFLDGIVDSDQALLHVSSIDVVQKSTSNPNMQVIALNDSSPIGNNLGLEDAKKGTFPVVLLNSFGLLPALEFGTIASSETLLSTKTFVTSQLSILLVAKDLQGGTLLEFKNSSRSIEFGVHEGNLNVVGKELTTEVGKVGLSLEQLSGGEILLLQISAEGVVSIRSENTDLVTLEGGSILLGQEPLKVALGREAKFKFGSLLLLNQIQNDENQARLIRGFKLTWQKSN